MISIDQDDGRKDYFAGEKLLGIGNSVGEDCGFPGRKTVGKEGVGLDVAAG